MCSYISGKEGTVTGRNTNYIVEKKQWSNYMKKEMGIIKFITLILTIIFLAGCAPKTARDYYNRAVNMYRFFKNDEKAIRDLTEAIRLDPMYIDAYIERGFHYYGKDNIDLVITDFNEAIKLNPDIDNDYGIIHCFLGDAYSSKSEWDLAISNYEKSLEIDPDYTEAKEGLEKAKGERSIVEREQRLAQRLAWYTEEIRKNPNNADLYLAWYTEEIRKNPNNADLYFERGYMYAYNMEYDYKISHTGLEILSILLREPEYLERAISDWKMALRINPNHTLAKKYLQQKYLQHMQ